MAAGSKALFFTNNNYFTLINKAAFMFKYTVGKKLHLRAHNSNQKKQAYRLWKQNSLISHKKLCIPADNFLMEI